MTEFDSLTDEELALLESWYQSPTFAAFCKVLEGCKAVLSSDAVEALKFKEPAKLAPDYLVQRVIQCEDLVTLFDAKFNPPEEPKEPESKPKTFSELMP